MAKSRKKKNFIVNYFTPFGLRQVCDIIMCLGFVTLIVGLCVYKSCPYVLIVGLCLFIVGALLAVYRSVRIIMGDINKRSPEYKSSIVNAAIMGAIFVLAVIGLVYAFLNLT